MPQHEAAPRIADHLTSILCAVFEETESHELEIFDTVVGALCQVRRKRQARLCTCGHAAVA
jgi:hypothetical protein